MKAVIYARVSSVEQAEGHSLDAQVHILESYAAKNGIEVVHTFAVPESASGTKSRKTYAEMLRLVKQKKIPAILFEKIDRSTRNLKETVVLDDWITSNASNQAHYVKENLVLHQGSKSHDRFKRDLFVILARQYIGNLSEEVKKGQKESVRKGIYPGTSKPGYLCAVGRGGHAHGQSKKPDPTEAPKIKEMFLQLSKGTPTAEVFRWASETAKIKNTRNGIISRTRFYVMIRDAFYCGQFIWDGILHDEGQHKPIVSKKLFYKVQDVLDGRANPVQRKQSYLFQSLVRDHRTQRKLGVSTNKGHTYYRLRGRGNKYIPEDAIDEQLHIYLSDITTTANFKEKLGIAMREFLKTAHAEVAEERKSAMLQVARLDQQLANAEMQLFDGAIDKERFEFHRQRIADEKNDLFKDIPEQDARKTDAIVKTVEDFVELIKLLKTGYIHLPRAAKAQLAKILLSNIDADTSNIYIQGKKTVQALYDLPTNTVWRERRDLNPRPPP